jgi:hypothetical protein
MKIASLTLAALVATGTAAAPVSEAHAGSCGSFTSVSRDIWKNYDQVILAAGCAVVTVASEGAVPPNVCLDNAKKAAKVAEDAIEFWNKSAKSAAWAKIGPRRLDLGERHQGRLVSTGGRVFITPAALTEDSVEVEIKKLDGKAKTEVTVCKDNHGEMTKLWTFEIDNGKDNTGKKFSKTLRGVRGHNLVVHFDAKSVSNTMQYQLTATER